MDNSTEIEWFTDYFGIDLPDYEIDFLDINLHSDVPLYLDPYAITKLDDEISVEIHNTLVSYFLILKGAIETDDIKFIRKLTEGRWSEPKEIYLGVGKSPRKGRGVGPVQEKQIIQSLSKSKVIKKGYLQSIQEFELFIDGIGPDKISDLVSNVILFHLARYTEKICKKYGVNTRPTALNGFWNPNTNMWDSGYFNIPVIEKDSFILVPRLYVRRENSLMDHREFYNKYILEVLQQNLLSANDSLVETLATGKRRVTKKSIKEDSRFEFSKEYISDFVLDNPDVLQKYRDDLSSEFNPIDPNVVIRPNVVTQKAQDFIQQLGKIAAGLSQHRRYEETLFSIVKFIFNAHLDEFDEQFIMDSGRGRIDIISTNIAAVGRFHDFKNQFNAYYIPIEGKNYTGELANEEFNQLVDRMGNKTTNLGFIICRKITDKQKYLEHCKDRYLRNGHMIVVLDDDDITNLLNYRAAGDYLEVEKYISKKVRAVSFGNT